MSRCEWSEKLLTYQPIQCHTATCTHTNGPGAETHSLLATIQTLWRLRSSPGPCPPGPTTCSPRRQSTSCAGQLTPSLPLSWSKDHHSYPLLPPGSDEWWRQKLYSRFGLNMMILFWSFFPCFLFYKTNYFPNFEYQEDVFYLLCTFYLKVKYIH